MSESRRRSSCDAATATHRPNWALFEWSSNEEDVAQTADRSGGISCCARIICGVAAIRTERYRSDFVHDEGNRFQICTRASVRIRRRRASWRSSKTCVMDKKRALSIVIQTRTGSTSHKTYEPPRMADRRHKTLQNSCHMIFLAVNECR